MGIRHTLTDSVQLLKNTFIVMGQNKFIFRPTLTELWIWGISFFVLFASLILFVVSELKIVAFILVLIIIAFMYFIFPFIRIYYRAAQTWIVYKTFTNQEADYKEGLRRAKENKSDIFLIGLFDVILTAIVNRLRRGSGRGGFLGVFLSILMQILGKVIEEGWDLIGHYLMPACIIPEKSVKDCIPEIPNLKNNVPGALVGVFGIDFVGDALRGVINGFLFLVFVLSVVATVMLSSVIPVLIAIVIAVGFNTIAKIFIEMTKTVYFTLFYMSITMPTEIPNEKRDEITNYLLHSSSSDVEQATERNPLEQFVKQYRLQGKSDGEIRAFFREKGWSNDKINEALK